MRIIGLVLLASFLLDAGCAALHAQAQSVVGCAADQSTLKDTYSPEETKRAEDFLLALRSAVAANDRAKVATMVQYPVRVNLPGGRHRMIRTPQQFRGQYDALFNQGTRKAIDTQLPQCMFARDQGVMIGSGQIWFQEFHGTFKIWSFNHMQ